MDTNEQVWQTLQAASNNIQSQVQKLYSSAFPIEVRHFCSSWIENQQWMDIDEDNPDHEELANSLCNDLIMLIQDKAQSLNQDSYFLAKLKLLETIQLFNETYRRNPMSLVRTIKYLLNAEQRLLDMMSSPAQESAEMTAQVDRHKRINDSIMYLQQRTQQTEEHLRALRQEQEAFILQHQDYTKINSQLDHVKAQPADAGNAQRQQLENKLTMEKSAIEYQLRQKAQYILANRLTIVDHQKEVYENLRLVQSSVLEDEVIRWKRQQQLAGNGAPFDCSVETLQYWCENLADLIWTNRNQIKTIQLQRQQLPINIPPGQADHLTYIDEGFTALLSNIVTSTFIIEKQPPQVLKKESKFSATVRLLVGGKLHVHMNPPNVKASIISEEQARGMLKNKDNIRRENSGDIINNEAQMEFHQATGQLTVNFRNMQLKRIRRAERKGNETVTEEKFAILFQSQFPVGAGELMFHVWTLSLPVVVTVHGNQECNALATILWDNAFAEPGRMPFYVPDKVPWPRLAETLNTKFRSASAKDLSVDNLNYLASKLFGSMDDYSNAVVSWIQFNREVLQDRTFTFWEWFYSILRLTKDWLQGPWKDGLIEGFVSKQEAQDRLLKKPNGTFLLRFSDSECGGVTIAWVAKDTSGKFGGERLVWNLAPFTEKDFKIRSIGDRIKDLDNLINLYPDKEKKSAFGKFWSNDQEQRQLPDRGYLPSILVNKVPVMASAPMEADAPTPQALQLHSPAPSYGPSEATTIGSGPMDLPEDMLVEFDFSGDLGAVASSGDLNHIDISQLLHNSG